MSSSSAGERTREETIAEMGRPKFAYHKPCRGNGCADCNWSGVVAVPSSDGSAK
jgi:hypothetical protein